MESMITITLVSSISPIVIATELQALVHTSHVHHHMRDIPTP